MPTGRNENPSTPESRESFEVAVTRTSTESLLYPEEGGFPWSEEITQNEELKHEAEKRRELYTEFEKIYALIPDATMDIKTALEKRLIDPADAAAAYNNLSNFLETEECGERLLIYFPFELLPPKNWKPESPEVAAAFEHFREVYLSKWRELLRIHEVRANFVDGDIPEPEIRTGDLPRVSKAAHFIPLLVQKQLLSVEEAITLAEESDDETLSESIAATFPTLKDLGLLSPETLLRMENSTSRHIKNAALVVESIEDEGETETPALEQLNADWLKEKLKHAGEAFAEIENERIERAGEIPEARANWEALVERKNLTEEYAEEVANALLKKELSRDDLKSIARDAETPEALICINAIRIALEKNARKNPTEAKELYASCKELIVDLKTENEPLINDAIEQLLLHLSFLGIVDRDYLRELGVERHTPDQPFGTENAETVKEFKDIAEAIEANAELVKYIFPIGIVYGSKIKGYGTSTADNDIAVFVRPGTSRDKRSRIKALLRETLTTQNVKGDALEFWLDENDDGLKIHDPHGPDRTQGDSSLTHVLFGGSWCGDKKEIKNLHQELLAGYLFVTGEPEESKKHRRHLEEMERDSLQYRLMHKGYGHFYPKQGGIKTKHGHGIDSNSMFWDAGYRRLATKLYLRKVFLPKLKKHAK